MQHTRNYYDGDFKIEGVVLKRLYGFAGEQLRPTETELTRCMRSVVAQCREMGLTEEEIEGSVRLNLRTYGYDDKTFPIDHYMGR